MNLYPLLMAPSFRHGKETPWGGHNLRDALMKDAPSDETGESLKMTTDAQGKASAMLAFTQDHLNQTYTYRLSEINDGRARVDYSEKIYEIAVAVDLDANRNIVVSLKMDGEPVQQIDALFQNIYVSQINLPDTGDDSCLMLYIALLLASGIALMMFSKRKADW